MEQFALLSKLATGIEVKVGPDEDEIVRAMRRIVDIPEENSSEILGWTEFKDEREPAQIVGEFAEIYPGGGEIKVQTEEQSSATVSYPLDFEQKILEGYTKYFSEKK